MNKLYLDKEAYEYLKIWAETVKQSVIDCKPFYKNVDVHLKNNSGKYEIIMHVKNKNDGFKFQLTSNKQIAKGVVKRDGTETNDFSIQFDINDNIISEKDYLEDLQTMIQTYATAYIHANAFLWLGNLADDKALIASGKNLNNDKIIVFRPFDGKLYAVPVGHHRSPQGVFEVRGHFRKYKTGNIIWIEPYFKGIDPSEGKK